MSENIQENEREQVCQAEHGEGTNWDELVESYEYLTSMIMRKLKTCQNHFKNGCLTLEDMYDLDSGHNHYKHKDSLWLNCVLFPIRALPLDERWREWSKTKGDTV